MSEKEQTLFDKLYDGIKETIKEMQKPLVRRIIKRKLREAYDAAQGEIDSNNLKVHSEIEKVHNCDLNSILRLKALNRTRVENQEDIKSVYLELFNEKLNPDIE